MAYYLYRIYYQDSIVYLGRTNQKLQDRIRGHLFKKPMHRTIYIEHVSKIEYCEFESQADRNIYEIYFINLWKPALNIDDKAKGDVTICLPEVEWKPFETPLWEKWKKEIEKQDNALQMRNEEKRAREELLRIMRRAWHEGKITEEEYYRIKDKSEVRKKAEAAVF